MKKPILATIVALCISIIALAGCTPADVLGSDAATASQTTWNSAPNKTTTDNISIKNFNVAGLIIVKNIDIEITRVFDGDNLAIDMKIDAINLEFGEKINSLLNILSGVLEDKGIDVNAMIAAANKLTAKLTANFNMDTWMVNDLHFATLGLGAVLGDLVALENDEYSIHKEDMKILKDDVSAQSIMPFITGHLSSLFGPAVGVYAGEPDVAAAKLQDNISPILEILSSLVPEDVNRDVVFNDVFGFTKLDEIIKVNLILPAATYSSTLDGEFINSQTYTSSVIFDIDKDQLSTLWQDVFKDIVGDDLKEITGLIPTIILMLDKNVPLLTIDTFTIASTYEIL